MEKIVNKERVYEPGREKIEREKIVREIRETIEKLETKKIERENEILEEERIIREKLKKEIEEMEISPDLIEEAKKKAEKIQKLDYEGKLKRLLDLAEKNSLSFAIEVAKNMNDPFVLDVFHDILVKNELYKKFKK